MQIRRCYTLNGCGCILLGKLWARFAYLRWSKTAV